MGGVEIVVKVWAGVEVGAMAVGCVRCAVAGGVECGVVQVFWGVGCGGVGEEECAAQT